MRAAVLSAHGQPPAAGERPDPRPGPGQAVVRVTAAPVVPLDLLCASGTSYFGPPAVPYVPGVQGVGRVESSSRLPPGTRVFVSTSAGMAPGDGSMAERCVVGEEDLVPIEDGVPDDVVAAIGLSGVAAWMALTWRAGLRAGERVVVLGAGGAVGQVGVGAAVALGAGRVVAVCRGDAARERALVSGASVAVAFTEDVDLLAGELAEALGGDADVVLDPVFGPAATAAGRVLAEGGRLVNLGGAAGDTASFSSALLRSRSASVLGYTNNALTAAQKGDALTAVLRHAAAGEIGVASETLPIAGVEQAWRRQAAGTGGIRLVLAP
ncbi:MAG: Zn-dependent oxidoreductase, NADPH:quinone reductase [Blastococcus sp.]|jgi:NADPH:quinone reductase-like Zn-dependent oxidoreductase|nr:Zn-dependent oxidoreductase, NADPH:quinone reductase [Blastococcus sp.]